MQSESDAPVCVICGEAATQSFGASLPLCPLASCEQALIEEINLTAQLIADQQGGQA